MDALAFHGRQPHGLDDVPDFVYTQFYHVVRIVGLGKQEGGNLVHPGIGTLGRKEHCDEQGVGVLVLEGDGYGGVQLLEGFDDVLGFFGLGHSKKK